MEPQSRGPLGDLYAAIWDWSSRLGWLRIPFFGAVIVVLFLIAFALELVLGQLGA
jgi:hypothetical protein